MWEQLENRKDRLAFRLSALIVVGTAIIFIAAFGYYYFFARNLILNGIEREISLNVKRAVEKIETYLDNAERPARLMAKNIGTRDVSTKDILNVLKDTVGATPEIFGSAVALEPYTHYQQSFYFAPYYSWEERDLKLSYLGSKDYDYFMMDWYVIPRELGRAAWSEPYFDEGGGNVIMSTFSAPIFKSAGDNQKFMGVVTADVSLEWLQKMISGLSLSEGGYAFLISGNGVFVCHPRREWVLLESIFSIAERENDFNLRAIGKEMLRGGQGFIPIRNKDYFTGSKAWMYYAPLPSVNWAVGVIIPEKELFRDLEDLNRTVLFICAGGIFLLFIIIIYICDNITKPLRRLTAAAGEISRGGLDTPLPIPELRDEIGELIGSFENMRQSLKEYIAYLKETTSVKERMESELKIGHTIQMSLLPQVFPPFPDRKEFDLYARIEAAREVGGDLYDFFLMDENTLFFCIGDVSEKGVPAALFMAITKTLMKASAVPDADPALILSRINNGLCKDNKELMFCTMICGLLDLRTGECLYSNAGHNPPIVMRAGRNPEWLDLPKGSVLGIYENAAYATRKLVLNPEDMLLLYTDGITEAIGGGGELYSPERLISNIRTAGITSPEQAIKHIMESIQAFSGESPQSDDITMMALLYKGDIS